MRFPAKYGQDTLAVLASAGLTSLCRRLLARGVPSIALHVAEENVAARAGRYWGSCVCESNPACASVSRSPVSTTCFFTSSG